MLTHYVYSHQLEVPISAQGSLVDGGERGMEGGEEGGSGSVPKVQYSDVFYFFFMIKLGYIWTRPRLNRLQF